jgi:hypothetical protein
MRQNTRIAPLLQGAMSEADAVLGFVVSQVMRNA